VSRTPTTLKWMVRRHATLAGDIARLRELRARLQADIDKLEGDATALRATMQLFDSRIDPVSIPPVRAWKGRYGRRGVLKAFLLEQLRLAYPAERTTMELAYAAALHLKQDFETTADFRRWVDDSLAAQLKRSMREGRIERLHEPRSTGEVGRWRWRPDTAPSLAHLRAQAQDQGLAVRQCDDGRA